MKSRLFALGAGLALLVTPVAASAFSFTFSWGDIPLCTTGRPGSVPNPEFKLRSVPQAAARIDFRMVDLNVPDYRHGGGRVGYSGQNTIAPGAFRYKSPCPPSGSHRYQWTATVKDSSGGTLATATATKNYP